MAFFACYFVEPDYYTELGELHIRGIMHKEYYEGVDFPSIPTEIYTVAPARPREPFYVSGKPVSYMLNGTQRWFKLKLMDGETREQARKRIKEGLVASVTYPKQRMRAQWLDERGRERRPQYEIFEALEMEVLKADGLVLDYVIEFKDDMYRLRITQKSNAKKKLGSELFRTREEAEIAFTPKVLAFRAKKAADSYARFAQDLLEVAQENGFEKHVPLLLKSLSWVPEHPSFELYFLDAQLRAYFHRRESNPDSKDMRRLATFSGDSLIWVRSSYDDNLTAEETYHGTPIEDQDADGEDAISLEGDPTFDGEDVESLDSEDVEGFDKDAESFDEVELDDCNVYEEDPFRGLR